jgi:predicted CXXCH cytochrome family protein
MALAVGCQRADQPAQAPKATPAAPPTFAGSAKCTGCHAKEAEAYRGSDHARAMQPATDQTVLGNFDQARVTHRGVTSTFFRRDGKFLVRTDGPDGKPGEFEIAYTFGVDPVQQYLVPFPGGRLQALGLAWDTRPRAQGGQRWFHLYPDVTLRPPDPIHWTGREQTWNFQCAECHSTDLRKRYDLAANRYATAWAELTVSCEECHGPGSAHVAWAETRPAGAPRAAPGAATGLVVRLGRGDGTWTIKDSQRGIAEWTGPARSSAELDVCARCHARRRPIVDPHPYGRPFLDTHVPALLEARLYHADGQILGEVYEWGSFVQSRMQRAGVTCSDCHEPHRATLRAAGNAVCAQCHLPAKFDAASHHHHRPESEAARCVSCHMPARGYMVVDPRRDHSLRVPRPDLSVALGTPNACSGCHGNRSPQWAADRVAAWGGTRQGTADFARTLDAARRGIPEAGPALITLAADRSQPGIVRATALSHFPEFSTAAMIAPVESALRDADALVRLGALRAVEAMPPDRRGPLATPLLRDPVRAVRLAAAQTLAGAPLAEGERAELDRVVSELVQSELVNADRPESHLNLANLYARLGRGADAESALRTALWLDPAFVPALVNLADLMRTQGRDPDGERFLEQARRAAPDHAEALHALALLRVRQNRLPEAVDLLRRAVRARPDSPRFAYVYAVALHDTGRVGDAITVLEGAHRQRPADRDTLAALATYLGERGDVKRALVYAEKLAALDPADAAARALVETLRRRAGAG